MNFVKSYFAEVGSDLESWTPTDFQESPAFLAHVDEKRKPWAIVSWLYEEIFVRFC